MILAPWTKRRLAREALAAGLDAQQREHTLRGLTNWDLASLNHALAHGTVEIVPTREAQETISDIETQTGYTLPEVSEMFQTVWRTR